MVISRVNRLLMVTIFAVFFGIGLPIMLSILFGFSVPYETAAQDNSGQPIVVIADKIAVIGRNENINAYGFEDPKGQYHVVYVNDGNSTSPFLGND